MKTIRNSSNLISITAIILSIVALAAVFYEKIARSDAIREEVGRAIANKEKAVVKILKPKVDKLRAGTGLPPQEIKTLEDLVVGASEFFDLLSEPQKLD